MTQPKRRSESRRQACLHGLAWVLSWSAGGPALGQADATAEQGAGSRDALVRRARELNRIAGELSQQGRYAQAIPYARDGLALSEQIYGKVHPNVAADLITLATLYRVQGDLFNAEPLVLRAIDIDRQIHGARHPEVGIDITGLAQLLEQRGDTEAAERHYRDAIAMLQAPGVPERYQPDLARTRYALGMMLLGRRRNDEAMAEFTAALPVFERVDRAGAARLLLRMADIERARGRQAQAQAWLDRAEALR